MVVTNVGGELKVTEKLLLVTAAEVTPVAVVRLAAATPSGTRPKTV
jgi:hypothetical protein